MNYIIDNNYMLPKNYHSTVQLFNETKHEFCSPFKDWREVQEVLKVNVYKISNFKDLKHPDN